LEFTRIEIAEELLLFVRGEVILPHMTVRTATIGAGATTEGETHTTVREPGRNTEFFETDVGGSEEPITSPRVTL